MEFQYLLAMKDIILIMTFKKAITHGGYAHRDDFISSCILFACGVSLIERKFPSAEELNDKNILVFDTGGEYDVDKLNFDHHQFPKEKIQTCALSLILKHLNLYESFDKCYKWLKQTEFLDVSGPFELGKEIGCNGEDVRTLVEAVEGEILKVFSGYEFIENGMWLYELMRKMGKNYIQKAKEFEEVYDYLMGDSEVEVLNFLEDLSIIFFPSTFRWNPLIALDAYVKKLEGDGHNIAIVVFKDDRGEGYRMSRYKDNPRIDFNLIEDRTDLKFVHANGFLAVTNSLDINIVLKNCYMAVK
jgi:uncharacterized UPF0160 family protein